MSKATKTKPKSATKDNKEQAPAPTTFSLADAARDLDKDPKAVRSRFRKLYAADDTSALPERVVGGKSKWVYRIEDREAVDALISNVK
jgi:hypothetical protein